MLHALLHGKLVETATEPDRMEDALTSVVFGALGWTNAARLLSRWLGVPEPAPGTRVQLWFWPNLYGVEPDVIVRLGTVLVCVEAKFRSNRSDVDGDDQLSRQYSRLAAAEYRHRYDEALGQALAECELFQAYVVSSRKRPKATMEIQQSRAALPPSARSRLHLVTWQSLFDLLSSGDHSHLPWANDVMDYLGMCELDTFQGIPTALSRDVGTLRKWRERADEFSWFREISPGAETVGLLQWSATSRQPPRAVNAFANADLAESVTHIACLLRWRAWRNTDTHAAGRTTA